MAEFVFPDEQRRLWDARRRHKASGRDLAATYLMSTG